MSMGLDWKRMQLAALKLEGPQTDRQREADRHHLISSASTRIFQAANDGDDRVRIVGRRLQDSDIARGNVTALYEHHQRESRALRREDFVGSIQSLFEWCEQNRILCFLERTIEEPNTVRYHLHARHNVG